MMVLVTFSTRASTSRAAALAEGGGDGVGVVVFGYFFSYLSCLFFSFPLLEDGSI